MTEQENYEAIRAFMTLREFCKTLKGDCSKCIFYEFGCLVMRFNTVNFDEVDLSALKERADWLARVWQNDSRRDSKVGRMERNTSEDGN